MAQLCGAFGSRVIGYAPRPKENARQYLQYVSLDELLRTADIVSLHCPLTAETKGLIGRNELSLMKPNAYLVNMARGPVVDANALAEALAAGRLAGAALDVFEKEPPLPVDHPLLAAPRCLVTPHIAFASLESMDLRAEIVFHSLRQWMDGSPVNLV